MLQHLHVQNYVLIQDISVDFSDQFNVFTGETGAGKSLLVDALNFVSGQRSSYNVVGKNDDIARVEAVFSFSDTDHAALKLKEMDLFDETVIVSREMNRDGRSVCRINQRIVNLSTLKSVLENSVDIHSQHETQYLLNEKNHLNLLDQYINDDTALDLYRHQFDQYHSALKKLNQLKDSEFNPDEIEFARFQLSEITELNPSVDDYKQVGDRLRELENFEKTKTALNQIESLLNDDPAIMSLLYEIMTSLEVLSYDELLRDFKDNYYQFEDLRDRIRGINSGLSFDEFEFDQLQNRHYQYTQSMRKFGGSVEKLLIKKEELELRINQSLHYDDLLRERHQEVEFELQKLNDAGQKLSQLRRQRAAGLETIVVQQLVDLMMEHAQFAVVFSPKEPGADGMDAVKFEISLNKGENMAPLVKVASGGELSRLMLGLKVIFSGIHGISTLIFDEIDTGVSGKVGFRIGEKMQRLAATAQVITITHLGSVAACADNHYHIYKDEDDERTITAIEPIKDSKRIEQLAMLISGSITEASLLAASELLRQGQSHG